MIFLLLLLTFLNLNFIASNLICDAPTNARSFVPFRNDPDDIIDLKFALSGNQVNEISFIGIISFNATDSLLQMNVKTLDFELNYIENRVNKVIFCRYDIPASGVVKRVFEFSNLNYLSEYTLFVGYTLKSGKSFRKKDSKMFTTCFGIADAPSNLKYTTSNNCSILIEWTAPSVINAPRVCFYEVKYSDGISSAVVQNVDVTSFKFTGKPNARYNFYIQSINTQKCYTSHSVSQSCKQVASMSATLTFTTSTSCKSSNSNSGRSINYNLSFYIFLFCCFYLFLHF